MTPLAMFVLIGILLVVIVLAILGRNRDEYDERQKLAQGRAAQLALVCLLVFQFGMAVAQEITDAHWFSLLTLSYAGMCVAGAVFGAFCIWADAFHPVGKNPVLTWVCIGLSMTFAVLPRLVTGELFPLAEEDGTLRAGAMVLFLLGIPVLWLLVLALRKLTARRSDE